MGLTIAVALVAVLTLPLLVVILRQRRQIARLTAHLSYATSSDPVTGLANRGAFESLVDAELERARRTGRRMSLIVGDVDGLEEITRERGHGAGDAVLQLAARDIQKWKRRIDSLARVGDQEFGLLLPETDERGALLLAERLRRAAHRTFGEEPQPVILSFGIASYPGHGTERDVLFTAATSALNAAKELGRDRSVVYSPDVIRTLATSSGRGGAEMQLAATIALAELLDIRDTGSTAHSSTVARSAELIARQLGLAPEQVERVRLAGVLHDVGKVGVRDELVTKPGPLDEDEWREMREHPELGARLLTHPELADLSDWVRAHHERPDGMGYPLGLAGDAIPFEARILAVADAYEAMTSDRPYRAALSDDAVRAELQNGAGTQFDPQVVAALMVRLTREAAVALPRAS
jgi:diguanylate cyclase (GGDEF)-like protein/putative nucleotidyltransferase with HDIG domain